VPTGEVEGEFTRVLSREEKRKLRKVEKHRPQFQFDLSHFRNGRKIGIAVSRCGVPGSLGRGLTLTGVACPGSRALPPSRRNEAHLDCARGT
jgi:hypothetical protein